ncbi:MAG: DUF3138 family protein [Deltaproteobacteria bacterium]|nr:DUF3138 family protein [Deltaproteobacteria bacterium]
MAGPETAGNDRTLRTLIDTSLIYKPMDDWTLALNYNWARDAGFSAAGSDGIADWQGVAAYADWKATDMCGLTLRTEYFDDDVVALGAATGAAASGRVFEGTLTSHTYLAEGLDLRFEFRHDQGNNNSFLRGTGASRKFQDTLASQLVYSF